MIKRKENGESDASVAKKPKREDTKKAKFEKKSTMHNKPKKGAPDKKNATEKPENWNDFKQKKKELRLKRKQRKEGFDVITKSKQIGEKLRRKTLQGGEIERNRLINELHSLLKGQGHYAKFVLAHDTSRIVQWMLKYSSELIKTQISKELIPVALEMMHSKYGIFSLKRLLKYGNQETKSLIIEQTYGQAVKLTSHTLSAPLFEYMYTTVATPAQKQLFIQEFFGDLYRKNKDPKIKHLRDVYSESTDLKAATLSTTKANLMKIINKNLLDSGLVQTVLCQFFSECSNEDRSELISLLIPHITVISNSRDGARVAMQCIWHGTKKERKTALKTIKEHVVELSKHQHGSWTIITLLDVIDDTVLLHKSLLTEILKVARDLAVDETGRLVLMWIVAPGDTQFFHPTFIEELEKGRVQSTSKKDPETRRKEILEYSIDSLLKLVEDEPQFWLKNGSLAYELWSIIKAGKGDGLKSALESIAKVIVQPDWTIKSNNKDILGIEDTGLHIVFKKLAKNDQNIEDCDARFGSSIIEALTDETLTKWLGVNRGCFLLVAIFENGVAELQKTIKKMVKKHKALLESQNTTGAKILLEKIAKK